MPVIAFTALLLTALTTLLHYEVLRGLNTLIGSARVPPRARLLVVVCVAFASHVAQIALYGVAVLLLVRHADVGTLAGADPLSFMACVYYSAETYTTLGFGDVTPIGPIRLLAGVEALNGLVLVGWTASYLYLAMERFWTLSAARPGT